MGHRVGQTLNRGGENSRPSAYIWDPKSLKQNLTYKSNKSWSYVDNSCLLKISKDTSNEMSSNVSSMLLNNRANESTSNRRIQYKRNEHRLTRRTCNVFQEWCTRKSSWNFYTLNTSTPRRSGISDVGSARNASQPCKVERTSHVGDGS